MPYILDINISRWWLLSDLPVLLLGKNEETWWAPELVWLL